MTVTRKIFLILSIFIMLGTLYHIWVYRYYFRLFPLPLSFINLIETGSIFLPSFQEASALGKVDLGTFDLTTEIGLRDALNNIQTLSPFKSKKGLAKHKNITFERWEKRIKKVPIYCTDGSQLLILIAWSQGLMAREWHLLPPGWPPGQGHSVAEFFNPRINKWQLVDAQHAGVVRDKAGLPLSMGEVLTKFDDNKIDEIAVDYGPYHEKIMKGLRGPTTEEYFFDHGLLKTPVLHLRQATWFAEVPKVWGLSGHLIIGYPIIMGDMTHNAQVLVTKASFLGFWVGFFIMIYALFFGKDGNLG